MHRSVTSKLIFLGKIIKSYLMTVEPTTLLGYWPLNFRYQNNWIVKHRQIKKTSDARNHFLNNRNGIESPRGQLLIPVECLEFRHVVAVMDAAELHNESYEEHEAHKLLHCYGPGFQTQSLKQPHDMLRGTFHSRNRIHLNHPLQLQSEYPS